MSNPLPPKRFIPFALLVSALACLAGCRDRSVTAYRIPKEPDFAAAPAAPAAAPASAPGEPNLRWTAPSGWQQQAASGMRIGSFTVPGAGGASADVSVISFPGTGGDDLANVNRWRDQVHLPPVAADALSSQLQNLQTGVGTFSFADLAGATGGDKGPDRLLGAWLRLGGKVWFFKMTGPADLVGAQRDNFLAFLNSVSLSDAAGGALPAARPGMTAANTNDLPRQSLEVPAIPAEAPPAPPPIGGNAMSSIPVPADTSASLVWQAPADWQSKPGNAMRKGSYAAGAAEVAITAFPGDVGGVLANVNRWRGQVGLDPIDDAGLAQATQSLDSNGLHFVVADAGPASKGGQRILAALLPWQGSTWFFKLSGPDDAVAQAKPAFLSFLRTVKAP
ncbi:MAG: hypothetical protein ABSA05_04780 [Opitutaceae bacterium]|jgi:hypothetical protein